MRVYTDYAENYFLKFELTEEHFKLHPHDFPHNKALQAKYDKGREPYKEWYPRFMAIRKKILKTKKMTLEQAREDLIVLRMAIMQKFPKHFRDIGWYDEKHILVPTSFEQVPKD